MGGRTPHAPAHVDPACDMTEGHLLRQVIAARRSMNEAAQPASGGFQPRSTATFSASVII